MPLYGLSTLHVLLCTQDASVSDASREVQYVDMVLQESLRLYPPGARYSGEVRAKIVNVAGVGGGGGVAFWLSPNMSTHKVFNQLSDSA